MRETQDLNKIWQDEIVRTFLLLKDWHENHEYYHKIGYLICSSSKTLLAIYRESKGKTKQEFLKALDKSLRNSISIEDGKNYADWNYNDDNKKIFNLLLLFNVESVRQNGENSQWFPFDKFKSNAWSLEHIHAVKSKKGNQKTWREWLDLHKKSLELLPEDNSNLILEIDKMLALKNISSSQFESLQEKIIKKFSPDGDSEEYINSISNLALLKCEINSALGNSTFDVKRNFIIEMDKRGEFIPFCTKMLFLKYYTRSEENQIHFWSQTDRKSYIAAINRVLENYLSKPVEEG